MPPANNSVDWQRIAIFCALALAISGSAAIYIALQGGLAALAGPGALIVLALWYMPGPALAHLLTRAVTREGFDDLWLRPRVRQSWPTWVVAWLFPAVVTILGAALFFAVFPQTFDPTFGPVRALLDRANAAGTAVPFGPGVLILLQTVQAVLLAPVLNALPVLGEEFGWRAYLLPKLMPLGWRRAALLSGVVWGVWHWPVLALGYNYGLDYAGAPWLGMLAFVWFTITAGTVLGWLTVRAGSVWPAVIGHGAINGIAALPALVMQGDPHPVLGPLAHGVIAGIPLALLAAWLWWRRPLPAQSRLQGNSKVAV